MVSTVYSTVETKIKHDINHVYKYNYAIKTGTINIHSYALHNAINTHTHMHKVLIEFSDGFNTVSYTHLDVYKRQQVMCITII